MECETNDGGVRKMSARVYQDLVVSSSLLGFVTKEFNLEEWLSSLQLPPVLLKAGVHSAFGNEVLTGATGVSKMAPHIIITLVAVLETVELYEQKIEDEHKRQNFHAWGYSLQSSKNPSPRIQRLIAREYFFMTSRNVEKLQEDLGRSEAFAATLGLRGFPDNVFAFPSSVGQKNFNDYNKAAAGIAKTILGR